MPAVISHQTVRLAPGRHRGPEQGADVLELASMLGGERFGVQPRCVCPVLRAFVGGLGDEVFAIADQARLRRLAAALAVTGRDRRARRDRARRCRERWLALHDGTASPVERACLVLLGARVGTTCAAAFLDAGRGEDALAFAEDLADLGGSGEHVGTAPGSRPLPRR